MVGLDMDRFPTNYEAGPDASAHITGAAFAGAKRFHRDAPFSSEGMFPAPPGIQTATW